MISKTKSLENSMCSMGLKRKAMKTLLNKKLMKRQWTLVKKKSPNIEPKESKASKSEEPEPVTGEKWRVQLSSNDIRREKSDSFYDLDADDISVLKQGNKWVYYYGCFDSMEKAQSWIDAHPRHSKNGQKPVKNISCDIADDELENSDEIKEVKKDQIKSTKDQPTKIGPKDDGDNQLESDLRAKPTEEVISAPVEVKQGISNLIQTSKIQILRRPRVIKTFKSIPTNHVKKATIHPFINLSRFCIRSIRRYSGWNE